jgi:branched-chain amino acid transport system substrate-binding protein
MIRHIGLAVALLALALLRPAIAQNVLSIQAILPLTGAYAFTGDGAKANLDAVAEMANQPGGIGGRTVQFLYHDDESSPQNDLQLASTLMVAHPPVIIGSAFSGLCNAMAPIMRNGPVLYCLSPAFNPPPNGYAFSGGARAADEVNALIRYFRGNGWMRIAVLNTIDSTGQNADEAIARALALPENASVQLVSRQHFAASDVSVAAQLQLVRASGAQALIAWTTGSAVATVFKGMIGSGLDIPVATSAGNETVQQMHQYADFLPPHLLMGSPLCLPHGPEIQLDPRVEAAQHRMFAVLKAHGLQPDIGTATSWDPGIIVLDAFAHLGATPSAAQIRQYILSLTDFPGVNGIYDFHTYPASGLKPGSAAVVTWDRAKDSWVWLSQPGGDPLPTHS